MSDLTFVDVTRYQPLQRAHELAVRQSELYEAMIIVEQCGASPEMTAAVTKLNERMRSIQAGIVSACENATGKAAPQKRDALSDALSKNHIRY